MAFSLTKGGRKKTAHTSELELLEVPLRSSSRGGTSFDLFHKSHPPVLGGCDLYGRELI